MKNYTIIHRDFDNSKIITHSTRQGKSKKEMAEMYRMNGVAVLAVITQDEISTISEQTVSDIETEIIFTASKKYKWYVKQVILEHC